MFYIRQCQKQKWLIHVWPKDNPEGEKYVPFRCCSWRHKGECRRWKGSQDFARVKEAILAHDHWLHVVLTYQYTPDLDIQALFRRGLHDWAKLRKRTQRRYGNYLYIQTWEVTRKGCPHCHMSVSNSELWHAAESIPPGADYHVRQKIAKRNWINLLQKQAVACGFGEVGWISRIRNAGEMAGYLTKLARELTGTGKEYQIPVDAPAHFRRLRASVGLLPPIHHNPDWTGELIGEHGEVL